MIRAPIPRAVQLALSIASIVLLLLLYSYLSYRQHQIEPNDKTIPTWSQLKAGVERITSENKRTGDIWLLVDSKATVWRLFLGMFWGVAGAVVLGILMGCFTPIESFFQPPLAFIAKLPPTAMLAVFFVLVGAGKGLFIAMIVFGILPVLAQSLYLAVKEVPEELRFKGYTLGASNAEVIWNIIFRYVLPRLIDAVRLQIGPAIVYLIAAEMLVADVGFGYRFRLQFKLVNMAVIYPYLVILAAFGFLVDFALTRAQKRMCPWYIKETK